MTTAKDGKKYKTKFYNLDLIISVGYRVKSVRGTQFCILLFSIIVYLFETTYKNVKKIPIIKKQKKHINLVILKKEKSA